MGRTFTRLKTEMKLSNVHDDCAYRNIVTMPRKDQVQERRNRCSLLFLNAFIVIMQKSFLGYIIDLFLLHILFPRRCFLTNNCFVCNIIERLSISQRKSPTFFRRCFRLLNTSIKTSLYKKKKKKKIIPQPRIQKSYKF